MHPKQINLKKLFFFWVNYTFVESELNFILFCIYHDLLYFMAKNNTDLKWVIFVRIFKLKFQEK